MAEPPVAGQAQGGARGAWEDATPPQGEDPFRPSAIIGRSPPVASRLGEAAGRRPSPTEHELGRDRLDGTIPE
ncbi:MAG: hypothetical protein GY696_16375, partial [Gammaproteobacteria bacterium]|nr:hypothetical protein [Gammaproteobacteria bacterium]